MSDESLLSLRAVLDSLVQPVLLVQNGTICYQNAAAAVLQTTQGDRISNFLGPATDSYLEFSGEGSLSLTLFHGETELELTIRRVEDVDLFAVAVLPPEAPSLGTLSVVAQTLRRPVSSMFSTAATLFPYLEELENNKVQPQTAALNRSFYQLLRLTGNLTDASQFLAGSAALNREPTELCSFFRGIYDQCAPLCQAAGISLACTCPDQPKMASIDRQKVERAVLNLISNALKFTPKGGEIGMHMEWTGASVLIRVSDNGEGMSPEVIATVFNRYIHHEILSDPRCGVGLGFPIVRHVAQLHGGTVFINSAPGRGTSVTMSLSIKRETGSDTTVRSPILNFDYAGGFNHTLVELSDAIPAAAFDSVNIN